MRNFYLNFKGRSYRSSSRRPFYEALAKRYSVVPGLVYLIAHGKGCETFTEYLIAKDLLSAKILVKSS